ncbi:copper resistance system multicopper oxidase [Thiomicrorhabdus sp.]|uniref:copper resistance system multicopper oxidase n=1 Tax=Thiomicrorhabdus sp. TaxID=2039724 RepID=UPI0029C80C13|nr:copper resistance system multicopper oxidase [Thiomicrorhabdus sp.]
MNTKTLNRRQFVKGMALSSLSAAVATHLPLTQAAYLGEGDSGDTQKMPAVINHFRSRKPLSGTEFNLNIAEAPVNITGTPSTATLVNGYLPAPTLVWREGDEVTIRVTNKMDVDTSIHWHGIVLPTEMDGVPGLSYPGIKPGETFEYRFTVRQHGTYWYHSHSGFQEQTGVYGVIVILPKVADPIDYDLDYVVQLSDWSDTPPDTIYRNLKKMGDYYNYKQRTLGDFFSDVKTLGFSEAWDRRKMWNDMVMSDRDLSDVTGASYTFLMNGMSPNAHWRIVAQAYKKIRLRIVNSSAMTFFDVRIPGLKMTVIAADGNLVQPVTVDEFRIGVAETYDVIVEPDGKQPYAIFAQAIDRSGYALGSITTDPSNLAQAPEMDYVPTLSMTDMGMSMHSMSGDTSGGGMKCGASMDMSFPSSMTDMPAQQATSMMAMNNQTNVNPMDGMSMESAVIPMNMNPDLPKIRVASAEGPQIEMRSEDPQYRLDDPGVGLRNNGRRVLTYADLKNRFPTRNEPKPTRELVLHLTGNMERYMWSINGIPYPYAEPLRFEYGERVRITFINDTMMNHPMHLHGMWSDLETGDENHIPRKHTVIVQPGSKISYRVTMDAEGNWAYHCHMLYHMLGMFRKVEVRKSLA